jgi:hypothetical protein
MFVDKANWNCQFIQKYILLHKSWFAETTPCSPGLASLGTPPLVSICEFLHHQQSFKLFSKMEIFKQTHNNPRSSKRKLKLFREIRKMENTRLAGKESLQW